MAYFFIRVLALFLYFGGLVLAQGWWKILAFIFPPYGVYLVVERLLGLLPS